MREATDPKSHSTAWLQRSPNLSASTVRDRWDCERIACLFHLGTRRGL